MKVQVLRVDRDYVPLPLVDGPAGEVRAVIWPGMAARHRSMHYVALPAGARILPQGHATSEAVYYVVRGRGAFEDLDLGASHAVGPGSFVLITPHSRYRIAAAGDSELVCVGGPCPPDPLLYAGRSGGSG
jgi:mannose-6-phosphate isomerase-like protein (cupin superfamily)